MRIGKREREFRAEFPNTRVEVKMDRLGKRYSVFAGDYLCEESYGRELAFSRAILAVREGLITPDPNEVAHGTV